MESSAKVTHHERMSRDSSFIYFDVFMNSKLFPKVYQPVSSVNYKSAAVKLIVGIFS